jgi:multidrug efflux pump subunit AcrB
MLSLNPIVRFSGQEEKNRMRRISRKQMVDVKVDLENGKPTKKQTKDVARKEAAYISFVKDTPLKSVDTVIRD